MSTIVYRNREWYAEDLTLYATEVLRAATIVLWGRTMDGADQTDGPILDQIVDAERLVGEVDDVATAKQAVDTYENTAMDDEDFARALIEMMELSSTVASTATAAA